MAINFNRKVSEMTFEEQLVTYAGLNDNIKKMTAEADKLKTVIKDEMKKEGKKKIEADGYEFDYVVSMKKTLLEDKAIQYMKVKSLNDCLMQKTVLDESAVINKIAEGIINVDEFENECYKVAEIVALKVKKAKVE